MILRFLTENGITPILLEIPDYDIFYAYEHQTVDRRMLRQLSMLATGSALDCREDYRQALSAALSANKFSQEIILLPHRLWDGGSFLPDRMHLNAQGYARLDSCIAIEISKRLQKKTTIGHDKRKR